MLKALVEPTPSARASAEKAAELSWVSNNGAIPDGITTYTTVVNS